MQGAIAAGNRITAEAGASVLADGGNAIDACIVAAFSAAVSEGPLTGPTGGGFLLAWFDGEATVLDCFFAAPSQPLGEMEEIVIDFGDASTQIFHVGAGLRRGAGSRGRARGGAPPLGSIRGPSSFSRRSSSPAPGSTPPRSSGSCTRSSSGILERDEGGRRIYGTRAGSRPASSSRRSSWSETPVRLRWPSCCPSSPTTSRATRSPSRSLCARRSAGRTVLTTPAPSRGGGDRRCRARAARGRRDARRRARRRSVTATQRRRR